tara:strand:+ start:281 stop:472 length:192 start_codon:yes stop_codon:yes gene_type:complete
MLEPLSGEFRNRISDPSGAIVSGRSGKSVNEKEWCIAKPYKALISVWLISDGNVILVESLLLF